jgi:hypothetical protein
MLFFFKSELKPLKFTRMRFGPLKVLPYFKKILFLCLTANYKLINEEAILSLCNKLIKYFFKQSQKSKFVVTNFLIIFEILTLLLCST